MIEAIRMSHGRGKQKGIQILAIANTVKLQISNGLRSTTMVSDLGPKAFTPLPCRDCSRWQQVSLALHLHVNVHIVPQAHVGPPEDTVQQQRLTLSPSLSQTRSLPFPAQFHSLAAGDGRALSCPCGSAELSAPYFLDATNMLYGFQSQQCAHTACAKRLRIGL